MSNALYACALGSMISNYTQFWFFFSLTYCMGRNCFAAGSANVLHLQVLGVNPELFLFSQTQASMLTGTAYSLERVCN